MRLAHPFSILTVKKIALLAIFATLILSIPAQAQAQTAQWSGVCVGGKPDDVTGIKDVATIQGTECLIANVFMVIITLIGLAGFVMFILGALRWMVSGSNTQGVTKARSTMMYAVAGLVISLCAFIIINLIADFTGVNVIRYFRIPTADRGMQNQNNCRQQVNGACVPPNSCPSGRLSGITCSPGFVCCLPPP